MDLSKRAHPLDWELNRRKTELARLARELAERELALATFHAELEAFRRRYAAAMAPHYAELDEIEAQAAEKAAELRPDDASKRRKAERARARADESAGHTRPVPAPAVAPKAQPADELRKRYRELAKLAHPDLATEPEERQRREAIMIQANAAYAEGDADTLAYLFSQWEANEAPTDADDVEAQLDRLMRQIAQATARLEAPTKAQAEAEQSEIAKLFRRAQLAERQGRDLMDRLVEEAEDAKRHWRKRIKQLDRRRARGGADED
jgi:hypothetical protein